jgi:2Fe-2S ferredoxin
MATLIELHFIHPDSSRSSGKAKTGQSLMQAALALDIDEVAADCGGLLTCATCHVYLDDPDPARVAALPAVSADEDSMLDFAAAPRQPSSRLSCQIPLTPALDGLQVRLPETQY